MPTTLVNETLSSSTNFYGSTGAFASGIFNASAEGMRVCKTPLTNNDVWFRFGLHNNSGVSHINVISSDGSTGHCLGLSITTGTNPMHVGYLDRYDTFSSWQADSNADAVKASPGVNFAADIWMGVTYARTSRIARVWANASLASQPDSVTSWGGVTALSSQTWDFSAVTTVGSVSFADQGIYCGLGADSTGTVQFTGPFTAGDFSSGGASGPIAQRLLAMLAARTRAANW